MVVLLQVYMCVINVNSFKKGAGTCIRQLWRGEQRGQSELALGK